MSNPPDPPPLTAVAPANSLAAVPSPPPPLTAIIAPSSLPASPKPALSGDLVSAENLGLLFHGRMPDQRDCELVFAKYDTNHDNALDETELTALITDLYTVSIRTSKYSEAYRAKATAALHTAHGQRMVQLAVRDLIAIRDSNQNGKLEHHEFIQQLHAAQSTFWFWLCAVRSSAFVLGSESAYVCVYV
jgi:hypothetical protein